MSSGENSSVVFTQASEGIGGICLAISAVCVLNVLYAHTFMQLLQLQLFLCFTGDNMGEGFRFPML